MFLYGKSHSPITTKFTGMGLSECDVISISKSDFIYEYEIKISRSDYKKDFTKEKHSLITNEKFTNVTSDGEVWYLLPNYFNYVVPRNLITIDEVPNYAGLIYINDDLTFDIIKKPSLLHKVKANNKLIRKLSHNLTCKLIFNKIS